MQLESNFACQQGGQRVGICVCLSLDGLSVQCLDCHCPIARALSCLSNCCRAQVAKKTTKQQQERKAPVAGFEIGFTPSNEVLLGRLSMLGFGSAVIGEFLSGQGPLAQLGYELGLQQEQVGIFLAGLIGFNLIASLLPNSATFKQQPQQQERAAGPLQDPTITLLQPAKFFNVTNWGFTPQNELFAGRLAALGMVAAIVGELVTGLGPVGQLSAGEEESLWSYDPSM